MRVKMILPALIEATNPQFRPIKYSLFPPLGLATRAGHLAPDDGITIQDEHVETLALDDAPDLVVIQVYITSAYRAYELADHYRRRGAYVCLALNMSPRDLSRPQPTWTPSFWGQARTLGRGSWPISAVGRPRQVYQSSERTLVGTPCWWCEPSGATCTWRPIPLWSRGGCPHACDFCYKESFFRGGRLLTPRPWTRALAEIEEPAGTPSSFWTHLHKPAINEFEHAILGHENSLVGIVNKRAVFYSLLCNASSAFLRRSLS